MSWLNNTLNTVKGQLTTLAHEILEETAGPGDTEYRVATPTIDNKSAIDLLADTQKDKEDLDKLCSEKESEIVALRKQIETLQNQISDTGGGSGNNTASGGANSGRTSKTPTDNNASNLEDSWCWEPDNNKTDNDHSSETSSGNGNEMVNITLEEIPLGSNKASGGKTKIQRLGGGSSSVQNVEFQKRIQHLEDENKHLNNSLEELDTQHNLAMQNMLELKMDLQEKLSKVTKDNEALKKAQEEKFISSELQMEKYRKQCETVQNENHLIKQENRDFKQQLEINAKEMQKSLEEMADLQGFLEKKSLDNQELLQRIKEISSEAQQEKDQLNQKLEMICKELEELKVIKEKKTSESSNSSTSKQSDDEFIVVREQDANSSGSRTPPTKEELKDKIVELENRVSQLTLENGSLSLKLQDREMEQDLSITVLKENLKSMQSENDDLAEKLRMALIDLEDQQFKINDLKEKAADSVVAQEQLKDLSEEKLKIAAEITKMKDSLKNSLELEKRLLISEQEKETLQLEVQSQKSLQERINEMEQKIQNLTYKNQQLQLNAECETETLNNSNELEEKLKNLGEENSSLKSELERLTDANFSRAIADEKQFITDLDDEDDEDESFSVEKLKVLIKAFTASDLKELNNDDVEKLFKNLKDKLSKLESSERDLSHLSAEVMDLQDHKLVWDHEKKTLEADISQYILQCDELMKNNEILLNELENYKRNKLETISENNEENIVQLESQLEECNNLNRTLEQEYIELNEKIEELEKENQAINEKLRESQRQCETLNTNGKDLHLQVETLELEKCNLLLKFNDFSSTADEGEESGSRALRVYEEKCESLEKQLNSLAKDHADLVAAMQKQKDQLLEAIQKREESEKSLRQQQLLQDQLKETINTLDSIQTEHLKLEQNFKLATTEVQQYKQELMAKDIVCESLQQEVKTLQSYLQEAEALMETKTEMDEQLMEKQQKIEELLEEHKLTTEKLKELENVLQKVRTDEASSKQIDLLHNEELQEKIKSLEMELKTTQEASLSNSNTENVSYMARIAELESQLLATVDLQKSVEALNYEKQEMIKALQQKHSENMQYYMEIQRLTPLVQQLQAAEAKPCDKCPTLETTTTELQKQQEKLQDQINFLKEKSDILTTNLLTEQTNQKLVQQEKADVMEQNATLRKDLERLRAHLLESEDMHTQEMIEMQKEFEETKTKMMTLEMEVNKSSNAYTSASIRANQHAETLQAQYAVVIQQRDELVQKLTLAEDRESKNQAALTNLQCALEQFQNDKDHDIQLATQRIRKELQHHSDKESQLQLEIQQLLQQLSDANQGLNAASRLSDQLEGCQQTINVLREEVDSLKHQKVDLEKKLSTTESSQTDKIEKTLIKSLLIGYVVSGNPNDKQQILRMISSVLDFSHTETDKVGLNKQQGGWLGSLLGGGGGGSPGSHSKDNLVQAFVQFLEQESQPQSQQPQMPNLLNIQHTPATATPLSSATPTSRRSSNVNNPSMATNIGGSSPTPVPIQPLLLNSSAIDDFSPSRNSSSILKDILNDS